MGLQQKILRLDNIALDACISASSINPKHIKQLCEQITRIRRSVSKRFEAGARMILDAVLLTIADISLDAEGGLPVAIFPEMQIAPVLVKNFETQFEVWLGGNVDYVVCTYGSKRDCAMVLQSPLNTLVRYTMNYIILVEARYKNQMLVDSMPEGTSQAIALSEATGNKTIRYCLSDGHQWMFAVYMRDDQGNHISYEGPVLTVKDESQNDFERDVQHLVEVLYHWLMADSDLKSDPLCKV